MSTADPSPLLFLCGHRKSGTTLLLNLLDGHPQLAVYPTDLTLLYAYFPEFVRVHESPQDRRARLKRVLFTDLTERLARLPTPHVLDVDAMASRFFAGLGDNDLDTLGVLIARLMAAFQEVNGLSANDMRRGVFKETSVEIYAAEILKWFPDARFVQVLRDPRDNFAAIAAGVDSYYSRLGEDRNRTLASLLHRTRLGMLMARCNLDSYGSDRYHLLRFEDLAAEPEATLAKLTDFLGIKFDPVLLAPTVLGQPTAGNNFEDEAMFAVSARNVGRWRERILDEEAQTIEFHLAREMADFGYEPAFETAQQVSAAVDFYKWQNYTYFYSDRFSDPVKT